MHETADDDETAYTSRSDRWVKLPAPPQRHDNFYIIAPLIHSSRNTLYVSLYKATIFHPVYQACVRFSLSSPHPRAFVYVRLPCTRVCVSRVPPRRPVSGVFQPGYHRQIYRDYARNYLLARDTSFVTPLSPSPPSLEGETEFFPREAHRKKD